jgi:hypothetical protein
MDKPETYIHMRPKTLHAPNSVRVTSILGTLWCLGDLSFVCLRAHSRIGGQLEFQKKATTFSLCRRQFGRYGKPFLVAGYSEEAAIRKLLRRQKRRLELSKQRCFSDAWFLVRQAARYRNFFGHIFSCPSQRKPGRHRGIAIRRPRCIQHFQMAMHLTGNYTMSRAKHDLIEEKGSRLRDGLNPLRFQTYGVR